MKVGDTVYVFDINYRVYVNGQSGPVYREHFRPRQITGETSRSWLVDSTKYAKKDWPPEGIALDQQGIDSACWDRDNRHLIAARLSRASHEQLLEVAKIMGYEVKQ